MRRSNSVISQKMGQTARLTFLYLAVMVGISVIFSIMFYLTSASALQVETSTNVFPAQNGSAPLPALEPLSERADTVRENLLSRLVLLNLAVLVVGAIASYVLARWTLRPIEAAMEAEARFVSDASHELKTPLAALRLKGEVALRSPDLTLTEAKATIKSNVEQAAKLDALSRSLLALAKSNGMQIQHRHVRLADVVDRAVAQLSDTASAHKVAVTTDIPTAATVMGHQEQLIRLVVILLDNAIKHSRRGGQVYIGVAITKKHATLSVRDEGPGIPAADLPHIFERFYQADNARAEQGFGLGLSIAQQIALEHNGKIWAENAPTKGAIFYVTLPRSFFATIAT